MKLELAIYYITSMQYVYFFFRFWGSASCCEYFIKVFILYNKKPKCPESASELYRPSEGRLSAKLVLTFYRITLIQYVNARQLVAMVTGNWVIEKVMFYTAHLSAAVKGRKLA
jgi:hypothetical protein